VRCELINLPFSTSMQRRLDPPLYLLQLAPVLANEGFSVRVNDLNGMEHDQWGFGNCMLYVIYVDVRSFNLAAKVTDKCREINSNALVVVCGSGPSKMPKKYLDSGKFTAVIRGEAEVALCYFIRESILEMCDEVRKVFNSEVGNINKLPLPDRSLVEMNTYVRRLKNKKATMIAGSRGSPFRPMWLCNGLKTFSVKRIANEVDGIVKTYGIRCFFFSDESFTFDRERALSIAEMMHGKGLLFGFNDVIKSVDIDLYRKLEKLGAREVLLNPGNYRNADRGACVQAGIEYGTNLRVTLKKDFKYTGPTHSTSGENNGRGTVNTLHRKTR